MLYLTLGALVGKGGVPNKVHIWESLVIRPYRKHIKHDWLRIRLVFNLHLQTIIVMALYSNMHMIIGSQQIVIMASKDKGQENRSGPNHKWKSENTTNVQNQFTTKKSHQPSLFLDMIQKELSEKMI
jgi:hypothetical protein